MPTTLTNGIQLPDKGSVDWYNSMQSNYNLIDTHLGDTDTHVTAEDKANWNSKQGSLSQAQLDAIAQVATNTDDIATLQSGKADASHTHSSSDITDIGDYATKQYVDNSISGLVDNAPAALDTLKELSTALNDDANFASTITTALAAKADSADLATVATSGDYNDLDNLPTIPTKTSDLSNDSDFVVSSNLATVATSGDYDDLSNKPSIPTNTSDLNNDSNFVDTSNPAVASGITSAKVTDYDDHIADTDIHVTTADKATWNTVTSKANDSDVVHKSGGSETISGYKTFSYNMTLYNSSASVSPVALFFKNKKVVMGSATDIGSQNIAFKDSADTNLSILKTSCESVGNTSFEISVYNKDSNNQTVSGGMLISQTPANTYIAPTTDNAVLFGSTDRRWSKIYGTEYYYGSNNVEFSDKFVTTDTAQTVGGQKTLVNLLPLKGEYLGTEASNNGRSLLYFLANRDTQDQSGIYLTKFRQNKAQGSMSGNDVVYLSFDCLENSVRTNNGLRINFLNFVDDIPQQFILWSGIAEKLLGAASAPWSDVYANKINGLNPGSLSFPDLSNGIDISSYITVVANANKESFYTPTVNGWISVSLTRTGGANMAVMLRQGNFASSGHNIAQENGTTTCNAMLPVVGGVQVSINSALADGIAFAYFYPCLGNV